MPNPSDADRGFDIEVSHLCKEFNVPGGPLAVIDDVSFAVPSGAIMAVVGPSGCGKSTLLRILADAESKTSGEVTINREGERARASIEQSPALFPWRTAFQNAHIGTEVMIARLRDIRPNERPDLVALRRKIVDDFALFELKGFEDTFPEGLSGGMQQRVAIIRALQNEPRILLCDEPFSAIDFVTRLRLTTEFKKISRNIGCTTVFVTHNIEEALFLGDRVLVLSKRPCKVLADIVPRLTVESQDAVKCRQSPEFPILFDRIWKLLNG